jgi:hypothetical protein
VHELPVKAGYFSRIPDTFSVGDGCFSDDGFEISDNSYDEGSGSDEDDRYDEYEWDTDDEVEEANANDNILRIIEGDWW